MVASYQTRVLPPTEVFIWAIHPLVWLSEAFGDRIEIVLIDQWGFAKHIRNRADAVRSLVMKALASEGIRRDAR